MLSSSEAKGFKGFRAREFVITPMTGKKTGQDRVIGLAYDDKVVALFLNDHRAALERSDTTQFAQSGVASSRDGEGTEENGRAKPIMRR